MKCSVAQELLYPFRFHWLYLHIEQAAKCQTLHGLPALGCCGLPKTGAYTFKNVKWSDSGTKNFSRAASLSSARSFGLSSDSACELIWGEQADKTSPQYSEGKLAGKRCLVQTA